MDGVTIREASENLPGLIERVERGEEVVITRDGVPVARLVGSFAASRREWTPEKQKALEESDAFAREPKGMVPWRFNREELYLDRFERE